MDILNSDIARFSLYGINVISIFLPSMAYFLLYKSFNNIWIKVAFYSELLKVVLDFIKRYFMQWGITQYDDKGHIVGATQPSKAFMYASYIEIALHIIFMVSFLVFLYVIYKQKKVNKLDAN